jgi:hypothetical protein
VPARNCHEKSLHHLDSTDHFRSGRVTCGPQRYRVACFEAIGGYIEYVRPVLILFVSIHYSREVIPQVDW